MLSISVVARSNGILKQLVLQAKKEVRHLQRKMTCTDNYEV
jgi:hypothetical protein